MPSTVGKVTPKGFFLSCDKIRLNEQEGLPTRKVVDYVSRAPPDPLPRDPRDGMSSGIKFALMNGHNKKNRRITTFGA